MKIRHKQTGEVEEVEPTMTVPGYGWCKAGPLDVDRYYPKAYWEPVPEEVWEDVTEGCHVYQDRIMYDSAGDPVCTIHQGYRLRKTTQLGGWTWVFRVERKRSGTYDERESNP